MYFEARRICAPYSQSTCIHTEITQHCEVSPCSYNSHAEEKEREILDVFEEDKRRYLCKKMVENKPTVDPLMLSRQWIAYVL